MNHDNPISDFGEMSAEDIRRVIDEIKEKGYGHLELNEQMLQMAPQVGAMFLRFVRDTLTHMGLLDKVGIANPNFGIVLGVDPTTMAPKDILKSAYCEGGVLPSAITVVAGQTITCNFTNTKTKSTTGCIQQNIPKWTIRAGIQGDWNHVTYGNGLFVAVPYHGNKVMTSPNGITWTSRATPVMDGYWWGVTYGNGLFVAIGNSDIERHGRMMTSPDGIKWTLGALKDLPIFEGITYANGLFVAVGHDYDFRYSAMTSPDGIKWKLVNIPEIRFRGPGITYAKGLFVVVGEKINDLGHDAITSPDGITWTISDTPIAQHGGGWWHSVTYGNGSFVAVGHADNDGGNIPIMTSPDGIKWTLGAPPPTIVDLNSVAYGDCMFAAVGYDSSGRAAVIISLDGKTWTIVDKPVDKIDYDTNWYGITYGNGSFVAVGLGDPNVITSK